MKLHVVGETKNRVGVPPKRFRLAGNLYARDDDGQAYVAANGSARYKGANTNWTLVEWVLCDEYKTPAWVATAEPVVTINVIWYKVSVDGYRMKLAPGVEPDQTQPPGQQPPRSHPG